MKRRQFIQKSSLAYLGASSAVRSTPWIGPNEKILKTDTHVHLVNLEEFTYPWLDRAPEIKRSYDIGTFQKAVVEANLGTIIFMESGALPAQSLKEIAWVLTEAKKDHRLKGIIARADVDIKGDVFPQVDDLLATPMVKGIRGRIDEAQLDSSGFVKGMRLLGLRGLSVDILLHPNLFKKALNVLKKCQSTTFILDHLGHPKIGSRELAAWKKGLASLAEIPNINCKISGAVSYAGKNWTDEMLKPVVHYAIEKFGFDRIVYGGDWPNSLRFSDRYMDWAGAFERLTSEFSDEERQKLYHRNADRIYRLS